MSRCFYFQKFIEASGSRADSSYLKVTFTKKIKKRAAICLCYNEPTTAYLEIHPFFCHQFVVGLQRQPDILFPSDTLQFLLKNPKMF